MAKKQPAVKPCQWMEDEGVWDPDCKGGPFVFNDDGPVENGFKFCPYCSGRLKAKRVEDTVTL